MIGFKLEKSDHNANPDLSYREDPNYRAHHSGWDYAIKPSLGKHWFNDGVKNYYSKECPEGCKKGMLHKS